MLNYPTKQQQKGWSERPDPCLVTYRCLLNWGTNSWPFFSFPGPQKKLGSSGTNLRGWISQLSLIWHPKEYVLSLRRFTGSQHLETQTTVQSTLSLQSFCSFQGVWTLGLHTWKMPGMKYGWSNNTLSFLSWPRYWGHSEGQTACFPSPVS